MQEGLCAVRMSEHKESWRFNNEVLKQLGKDVRINKGYKRLMSRSATLFKVKQFKLVASQQVLENKRT